MLPLLFPEHLNIGSVARLTLTNAVLRNTILQDASAWSGISAQIGLKRNRTGDQVMALMRRGRRCRECGCARGALRALDNVYVCSRCANDAGGYSRMCDARGVEEMLVRDGWQRRRLPSSFRTSDPPLKIVRRTRPNQKRLFWYADAREYAGREKGRKK